MENYVIYDELVNRCSTIEGGVNNVQGTLDASNLISADSVVKSVQRGTTRYTSSGTKTIPISAVNMNKSMLASEIYGRNSSNGYADATITLTNSTTIQLNLTGTNWDNQAAAGVSWQVVEFY